MKKILLFAWEIIKIVVIALVIVIPIRYFVFEPFIVKGQSMEPNFKQSDYLIVDKISYRFREPKRGEVIVFEYPQNPSHKYIKRIIGLPGETISIQNGEILIYKKNLDSLILNELNYFPYEVYTRGNIRITLDKNKYFVLGDNRVGMSSYDSRHWGSLPRENIIGKVLFRLLPIDNISKIGIPVY